MKLFVWDFHGVLEKGNKRYCLLCSNLALEKAGINKRFVDKDINLLYGLQWNQFFEYILPEESSKKHKELEKIAYKINNKLMYKELPKYISANDHASEVLEKIIDSGNDQILISNSGDEGLSFFLKTTNLTDFFPNGKAIGVHGPKNSLNRTKKEALEGYIKDKNYEKIIPIGDSKGDVELKQFTNGIPTTSYLYAHSGQPFREAEADYKIHDLREILREI